MTPDIPIVFLRAPNFEKPPAHEVSLNPIHPHNPRHTPHISVTSLPSNPATLNSLKPVLDGTGSVTHIAALKTGWSWRPRTAMEESLPAEGQKCFEVSWVVPRMVWILLILEVLHDRSILPEFLRYLRSCRIFRSHRRMCKVSQLQQDAI